jgi:hypothetical protein
MHGMCFNEGNSGRCGFRCRAFTAGDCHIADEMIFNVPITYSDYLDAIEFYPHLAVTGTKMKRLTDLMLLKMAEHNKQMQVLIAMANVPWENLKVDEVVYVSDDLQSFIAGTYYKRHFRDINGNNLFSVYSDGASSQTSGGGTREYKYALPVEAYKSLIGN